MQITEKIVLDNGHMLNSHAAETPRTRTAHKNRVFIINPLSATSIWVKVKFWVKVELWVKVKFWVKVNFFAKVEFWLKVEFIVKVKFWVKVEFWVKVKFWFKVMSKVNVCVHLVNVCTRSMCVASGFARWSMYVSGMLILVLVLKDSLRTFFKSLSLSWSLGVRSFSLSLSLGGQVQEVPVLVLVLGGQVLVLILVLVV